MINIFNLFLFLCALWALLSFVSGEISVNFIIFGLIISLLISIISWKLKIINKNFNFLFLNLGFYKHFIIIFIVALSQSIIFLLKITFSKQEGKNCLFHILPKKILNKSELSLFVATISFIPGISYLGTKKDNIVIYALNKDIFDKIDLSKIYDNIHKINDDSLI